MRQESFVTIVVCGKMTRRVALAGGTAVAATVLGLSGPASASTHTGARPFPAAPLTEVFGYVGAVAQYTTVPAGASGAIVRVIGAAGGKTATGPGKPFATTGGDGAQVSGTIAVQPGQVLVIQVGGYGGNADSNLNPGPGGWGPTGNGGRGGGAHGYVTVDGAGGGGATSLGIAGCVGCTATTVVIAGGGGGAGGRGFTSDINHGGPGGSSGATVDAGHNGGGGGAGSGGGGGGTGGGGGGGGGAGSSNYTASLSGPSVVRGTTSTGNGLVDITWISAAG